MTSKQREAHEALIEDIAAKMSSPGRWSRADVLAILSLIAQRLSDVTEEMKEASRYSSGSHLVAYRCMLSASALFPGDRT